MYLNEGAQSNYKNDSKKFAFWTVGNKNRKLWIYPLSYLVSCEIPFETESTKSTNCCSWSCRTQISPARESQRDFRLLGKPVHASWLMWRKP